MICIGLGRSTQDIQFVPTEQRRFPLGLSAGRKVDMALRRCTRSVDGTIPVPALLYDDEEVHASQDGVGIYDGYVYNLLSQGLPSTARCQ